MLEARDLRLHPAWWTVGLVVFVVTLVVVTMTAFTGGFVPFVPVTLASERAGLVMDPGGKVKMRGVQVGRVEAVGHTPLGTANLQLRLNPAAVKFIPANVQAQIRATTVFGSKFVELIPPEKPVAQRIKAGATLYSRNVTTEANTAFENLTLVLKQVDPAKLNGVLTALSDGFRGKGARLAEATTDANELLTALNPRMKTLQQDWRSLAGFSDTYSAAAKDILQILSSFSTTAKTITSQSKDLSAALLATTGLSHSGIGVLGPNMDNFIKAFNRLQPTTDLLFHYNPILTCTLQGGYYLIDPKGLNASAWAGGNGRTVINEVGLAFAVDPYRYPQNLPVVAAKGGPDGKPGCGALPHVDQNMPVRYLVTNTGWGTGMDLRPNPGIAHPYLENFFPVTKAIPEPPRIWGANKPPAIGPVAYPGAPPYGAPLYAPDGTPLWSGPPPGMPPPPVPGIPNPPPPYGTGTGPPGGPR